MLSEDDLERAACKLSDFRQDSSLSKILDQYAALIESYKQLKSDYEEERDIREKYKRMAQGHGGKPFVLVLVNGDDYDFPEHLVTEWESGGHAAAEMLKNAIMRSPRWKDLDHCEIMVRVYVNMQTWAEVLQDVLDPMNQSISVSAFAAGFNKANNLFDIVDTGDMDKTDDKLRATLELHAASPQCKHIFFAGCFDGRYVPDLAKQTDMKEKFTLIQNPEREPCQDLLELGMNIETYDTLFEAQRITSGTRYGGFALWTPYYPRSTSSSTAFPPDWFSIIGEPIEQRSPLTIDWPQLLAAERGQSKSPSTVTGKRNKGKSSAAPQNAQVKSNTSAKLRNVQKENVLTQVAKESSAMDQQKSQKTCKFFRKYGECRNGLDCRFVH
ncbi:hypothetical protein HDV57DRAFT_502607 [Trichoderma longibrachiatum]|uniref:C3H1-type domain-containing protein n=1 Tax=Trichoderma longibrachiatum ATCC 18648 TaxID=983965 RepID=A0A2T4C1G5_TRILO|nr:hypothetical protein M440DRAFT_1402925 [Trichoderma longibrachiatum ATCC 18648]